MPGQFAPFETPFDKPGRPVQKSQFVYLTNRGPGRYSGLLPMDFDWRKLGWGLADYFPQGYTNLLRVEKIYAAHPDPSAKSGFKTDNRWSPRAYHPKGLDSSLMPLNKENPGNLFLVFREPISSEHTHDIIGKILVLQRAINMADRYSATYGRRAVVGQLITNTTWH